MVVQFFEILCGIPMTPLKLSYEKLDAIELERWSVLRRLCKISSATLNFQRGRSNNFHLMKSENDDGVERS
jgi:hypothetical protein